MRVQAVNALIVVAALAAYAAPASAGTYPVSGRWGVSDSAVKGAIDCSGKRVITFQGDERFDSGGGVPAYHNKSVTNYGSSRWRIVDQFSNAQVYAGNTRYTLVRTDADHIALDMTQGGTLKLQRCK